MKQFFLFVIFIAFYNTETSADWIASSGTNIPSQAFVAVKNEDGEIFYICRASVEQGDLPGKLIGASGYCLISVQGSVYRARKFDVLVGNSYDWIPQYNGDVPFDALATGKQKDGKTLYSCRGEINSVQHPGKILRDAGGCRVPYKGRELKVHWYEVLIGQ